MDLRQLEYFIGVAEMGSFTRASAALGVAQPALSRQVRLLEVELRQALMVRTGRGVIPTEAGDLLLAHGRGILHQVERAREELGRLRGALAGRVALGLPTSIAKALTVPLTRAFRARLPEASLSITEGLSFAMHQSLLAGRLDIALLYNVAPSPDIEVSALLEEDLFLVQATGARGQPRRIALEALAELPLVIPTRPNAIRMLIEAEMARIGCRPRIALEIDGVAAILDLVADGAGCAVLSKNAVAASGRPAAFAMRPIGPPALRTALALVSSSRRPVTRTQQAMVDLVRQMAAPAILGGGASAAPAHPAPVSRRRGGTG